ncbi:MAG: DNA mismatch repair protein MutS [Oscillospiraceae bacterium]|nr:DNA mismatch repair protein MutS [Oscillospiraceae bacterium]
MAEMTPMMRQYFEVKRDHPDCILFFRLGDFYEMFADDARTAARELDLVLTSRDKDKNKSEEEKIPMCGIPYHACDGYIARLVQRGYKVAICEQMEDPATAKGLVKRDVTRIITPGTVTESAMLDERKNNYFACVYGDGQTYALAFCDISTGAFSATAVRGTDAAAAAASELARFQPAELLLGGEARDNALLRDAAQNRIGCYLNFGSDADFDEKTCANLTQVQFCQSLDTLGIADEPFVATACGALLARLREMQKNDLSHVRELDFYRAEKYMLLNMTTRRNLELTETMRSKERRGTLLWVLDKTKTPMGSRLMRAFLEKPLMQPAQITKRHDAVEELCKQTMLREELILALKDIPDLERATARIVTGSCNCRDMLALAAGAAQLPRIRELLAGCGASLLQTVRDRLDELQDMRTLIDSAIREDAPLTLREGGIIKPGYNDEVDRLAGIQNGGAGLIVEMEMREKERTGIKNLRIRYNRVFGYSIEVSNGQLDLVPDDYIRKQTLVNGERFITQELKELESTILTAKDRLAALEYQLFSEIRARLSDAAPRILQTAHAVAYIDVLCSFAAVAVKNRYCRPEIDVGNELSIKDGRHPVVEQMLKDSLFVPNDVAIGAPDCRALIITGPNMAGKSTYMRQIALIVLMAQIGSFVPASAARIGIVDRLFTRVGASDDLSSGQSTFMVEMTEVAEILRTATPRSLLILDEIGRGTSTFDGMAIARAVLEHCADPKKLGAKTLFATHYHELADMAKTLDGVQNCNIAVKKRQGEMVFLRKIVPGPAAASYGVEVAKLAGLPDGVVNRARRLLDELESGAPSVAASVQSESNDQISLDDLRSDELREKLAAITPETLTPIEALNVLYQLKQLL